MSEPRFGDIYVDHRGQVGMFVCEHPRLGVFMVFILIRANNSIGRVPGDSWTTPVDGSTWKKVDHVPTTDTTFSR